MSPEIMRKANGLMDRLRACESMAAPKHLSDKTNDCESEETIVVKVYTERLQHELTLCIEELLDIIHDLKTIDDSETPCERCGKFTTYQHRFCDPCVMNALFPQGLRL